MCGSGTTCKMAKLNNRNYIITNTLDVKEGSGSKTFYLLEKSHESVEKIS